MAYVYFCNNPKKRCTIGDCVCRALSLALNKAWDEVYIDLVTEGFAVKDMPSANEVWSSYLYSKGFYKKSTFNQYSYSIEDFCNDHPYGIYVVCTGTHVVCCKNGDYFDTWNSGQEEVTFYFEREDY